MSKDNNVGTGTPSSRLKATHTTGSFRDHVQEQKKAGNADAVAWQNSKLGKNLQKKTPANIQRAEAEKFAKKNKLGKKK